MMTQNDAVNCGQSQTASDELRAEERVEYPLPGRRIHAAAGILDLQVCVGARRKTPAQNVPLQRCGIEILPSGSQNDPAPLCSHCLGCVGEKVHDHLTDQGGIHIDYGGLCQLIDQRPSAA